MSKKWPCTNEGQAYRKTINCTNKMHIINKCMRIIRQSYT
jgi:hypothetical protein